MSNSHNDDLPDKLPFMEYSVSRETVFRYGDGRLEVREITRFPWVDGELPQAPPCGISPCPILPLDFD